MIFFPPISPSYSLFLFSSSASFWIEYCLNFILFPYCLNYLGYYCCSGVSFRIYNIHHYLIILHLQVIVCHFRDNIITLHLTTTSLSPDHFAIIVYILILHAMNATCNAFYYVWFEQLNYHLKRIKKRKKNKQKRLYVSTHLPFLAFFIPLSKFKFPPHIICFLYKGLLLTCLVVKVCK